MLTDSERIEILWGALDGLHQVVDEYAPRSEPNAERFLANDNGSHGIERELGIARAVLSDANVLPPELLAASA